MEVTIKEAIRWLKMQSSKPIKWDDYSEENRQIREEAERRMKEAFNMAIGALKVQEPVEPKMMEFVDKGLTWEKYEVPTCGVCGALLGDALFCPNCGRAVKWE